MQPGGRCRDRSFVAGVHGLVAVAVQGFVVPFHVWRQRQPPEALQRLAHAERALDPNDPAPVRTSIQDAHRQLRRHDDHPARLQFSPRADECFPDPVLLRVRRSQQQHLGRRPGRLSPAQARRKDPRVVDHQEVAGIKEPGKVAEAMVVDLSGGTAQHQQTRIGAPLRGVAGDPARRQFVVEIRGHAWAPAARGQNPHGIRAAMHPRWPRCSCPHCKARITLCHVHYTFCHSKASLCVAPRANSSAILPSSRLASPAPRRSRCSRGFIHGLLGIASTTPVLARTSVTFGAPFPFSERGSADHRPARPPLRAPHGQAACTPCRWRRVPADRA